jgi:hypothetical protein
MMYHLHDKRTGFPVGGVGDGWFQLCALIAQLQLGHLADAFIQSDLHRLIHTLHTNG